MHGKPTGLESADSSRSVDASHQDSGAQQLRAPATAVEKVIQWLEAQGEHHAARALTDAFVRWHSSQEGQRSRETLDGQNPQDAKVG